MQRLPDIIRHVKCAAGLLLIVSFFLPWVALTPSCMDKTVVVRDNISGFDLVRDGIVYEAVAVPIFGAAVLIGAFFIRGTTLPLFRSLVSLVEIPAAFFVLFYVDLALRLFTPFIVRYGYLTTEILLFSLSAVSLAEVVAHFPRLAWTGKIIVAALIVGYIIVLFTQLFI